MSSQAYLKAAADAIAQVAETQQQNIEAASELLVKTILSGQSIFSFGASHSFMITEELVYRTGGLMVINPIYPHGMNLFVRPMTATSRMERVLGLGTEILASSPAKSGDALILTSTSGRNAVTIDMAIEARHLGIRTICITSLTYSQGVISRHPSGKKLADLCDVTIDNCAPHGDAAVEIDGFPQKIGPISSITGCAIGNSLVAEVVSMLIAQGAEPPVFVSANIDGGDAWNERLLNENRERIHYMD